MLDGSAAGSIGIRREIEETAVLRTGAALGLCPDALEFGAVCHLDLLGHLAREHPEVHEAGYRAAVQAFKDSCRGFSDLLYALDDDLWPTSPPSRVVTILWISSEGGQRWYLHHQESNQVRLADPPELSDEDAAWLAASLESIRGRWDRQEPVTIAMDRVFAKPHSGSLWRPAAEVLQQHTLRPTRSRPEWTTKELPSESPKSVG